MKAEKKQAKAGKSKTAAKVTEINLSGKPFNCKEQDGKYVPYSSDEMPDIPDNCTVHYVGESVWLNIQNVLLHGIPQEYDIRLKYKDKNEEVRITGDSSQIFCCDVMNIYDLPLRLTIKAFSSLRESGYKVFKSLRSNIIEILDETKEGSV